MILEIPECKLIESCFTENGYKWSALKLIEAAKDCEVFEMPLAGIPLDVLFFTIKSTDDFIYHAKRVEKTNLDYPIILSDKGVIADGWHRVVKAILEGKETIKAKRLQSMPDADSYDKPEEK